MVESVRVSWLHDHHGSVELDLAAVKEGQEGHGLPATIFEARKIGITRCPELRFSIANRPRFAPRSTGIGMSIRTH